MHEGAATACPQGFGARTALARDGLYDWASRGQSKRERSATTKRPNGWQTYLQSSNVHEGSVGTRPVLRLMATTLYSQYEKGDNRDIEIWRCRIANISLIRVISHLLGNVPNRACRDEAAFTASGISA
jgi:hypothetical protein